MIGALGCDADRAGLGRIGQIPLQRLHVLVILSSRVNQNRPQGNSQQGASLLADIDDTVPISGSLAASLEAAQQK
jgi:hypothetical protein